MGSRCDVKVSWAERAAFRGVAIGVVSSLVFTALLWPGTRSYYDSRFGWSALLLTTVVGMWLLFRVARDTFRHADIAVFGATHVVVLALVAVAPTSGPPPQVVSWVQPWTTCVIIGAILLLPLRRSLALIAAITVLQGIIRVHLAPLSITMVEAAIQIVGAWISLLAARFATERFEATAQALDAAAAAESETAGALVRARARAWWNRLLHDKVLGALLLASRATSPVLLDQARTLARDAIDTIALTREPDDSPGDPAPRSRDEANGGRHTDASDPGSTIESTRRPREPLQRSLLRRTDTQRVDLAPVLTELATGMGLTPSVKRRGRGVPASVAEPLLAAAEQAMRNVVEHAGVNRIRLRVVQYPMSATVTIADDGVGFDPLAVDGRRHGLRYSMPGHVAAIDGQVRVKSTVGVGTTVDVDWAAKSRESAAPVSAEQIRRWSWITVLFAGLHALGGVAVTGRLAVGILGSVGLAVWVVANGALNVWARGRMIPVGIALLLLSDMLMLWPALAGPGWAVWFLGASLPSLCVPAMRGRPRLSLLAGVALFGLIVAAYAVHHPDGVRWAWPLALPFLAIPTIASLYAVMLARADAHLRAAQRTALAARQQLDEIDARARLLNERMGKLASGTVELLQHLVSGDIVRAHDRQAARALEWANRDQLVAPDVVTPSLAHALAEARARGVVVHLSSTNRDDLSGDESHPTTRKVLDERAVVQRLGEFRRSLMGVARTAYEGDRVTARWQPDSSYAAGTIACEPDTERTVPLKPRAPLNGSLRSGTQPNGDGAGALEIGGIEANGHGVEVLIVPPVDGQAKADVAR